MRLLGLLGLRVSGLGFVVQGLGSGDLSLLVFLVPGLGFQKGSV